MLKILNWKKYAEDGHYHYGGELSTFDEDENETSDGQILIVALYTVIKKARALSYKFLGL